MAVEVDVHHEVAFEGREARVGRLVGDAEARSEGADEVQEDGAEVLVTGRAVEESSRLLRDLCHVLLTRLCPLG